MDTFLWWKFPDIFFHRARMSTDTHRCKMGKMGKTKEKIIVICFYLEGV